MTANGVASPRWFGTKQPAPDAAIQLFCLPYAGGGASSFHGWARKFEPAIDLFPVALPGREARIAERATIDASAIAAAIHARADRPYAIYGHSMGGKLGFETICELRRIGAPLPVALVVVASRPLDQVDVMFGGISQRGDDEMLARLVELGGISAAVLAEPELVAMMLPILRADFGWLDAYRQVTREPVPVPLIGFAGADDHAITPAEMVGWSRHTTAGFELITYPGGHFFSRESVTELAAVIQNRLTRLSGPHPAGPEFAAPAADEVHVWFADLDELPDLTTASAELAATELPAAELAEVAQLPTVVDRRRQIAAHVLARRLLSRFSPIFHAADPSGRSARTDMEFARTGMEFHASVSQHGGRVLVGVARGRAIKVALGSIDAPAEITLEPDWRVSHLPLPGVIGAVASPEPWTRLRFATVRSADLARG